MNKHLDDLLVFCEVMRHKSYTKASESIRVSKSHVSKAIVRLEDNLGAQLFERGPRRVIPSLAAEDLYRQIDDNLNNINRSLNEIRSSQSIPKGRLRITAAGEYGEKVITQKCIEFTKMYPEVDFDIIFSNEILDLAEHHIDVAIRTGILPDSNLIARPIGFRSIKTVCSANYAQLHSLPNTPNDLKSHNCLIGSTDEWVFQDGKNIEYMKVWGKWQSNNGNSLVLATLSGLGISQLPDIYTRSYIEEGRLVECLTEFQTTKSPIWAVFQKKSANSLLVRKFIDTLLSK
ncbi:LysR family transcriptional regulator [Pseudoalteromonas sp. NCCP-2140]|uniref:LysR family transcriptional regulator n=1 Tax=Pseudoalteromonas sp. NCCP-2140 TaxID=2942288 RepID=UPI00203D75FE|nr:LysR family transcriptional regulator [Pseudoalteromonas sp. NCCP-2140]GKW52309.1 LysR family transcriptional regulator [Pseudoalteromonas sp. NCCP-2140]